MGAGVANERGDPLGLIAAAFYAVLFCTAVLRWRDPLAWGRAHPLADRALMAPLTFFAAAFLTDLPLWVCAAIGLAAAAVLVLVDVRRRRAGA
jgi:hypothetical protein